jgi:ATP/maltotriose-dependent transcriptional regulator MalT
MSESISQVDGVVTVAGSATQKAQFFQVVALLHMRRERFLLSDATLEWARRAYEAASSGQPVERPAIHFTWAFALLFRGHLDEAWQQLQHVLKDARRSDDTAVECRALTYLLIIARHRGQLTETREMAERTLSLALTSQMKHYIAAGQASLGWAGFLDGNVDSARTLCEAALECWKAALPSAFPFQWLARWPLVALAHERGDEEECRQQLAALLDISQQRMHPALTEKVEVAVGRTAGEGWRPAVSACLNIASSEGLL